MGRTEHFHDPKAPKANSIVVAASAFVRNLDGQILMIKRSDNGYWSLPGGTQEIGEFVSETVEREVTEETGLAVKVVDVIGIYSDPNHVMSYGDGEVRQQFALLFRADPIGGELSTSEESPEVRWVKPSELTEMHIHPSIRLRLQHGLNPALRPYIG